MIKYPESVRHILIESWRTDHQPVLVSAIAMGIPTPGIHAEVQVSPPAS